MNPKPPVLLTAAIVFCWTSQNANSSDYWSWNWSSLELINDALDCYQALSGAQAQDTLDQTWEAKIIDSGCLEHYGGKHQTVYDLNRPEWDPESQRLLDRWGAPFVYVPAGSAQNQGATKILRSSGPNQIDDGGLLDDLRWERGAIQCNNGFHWKSGWPQARNRSYLIGFIFVFLLLPTTILIKALRRYAITACIVFLLLGYISVHKLWFARVYYPYMRPPYDFGAGLLIVGVIAFHGIRAKLRRSVSKFRLSKNRCPGCDYDLTDLGSPRCPECGSTIPTPGLSHSP